MDNLFSTIMALTTSGINNILACVTTILNQIPLVKSCYILKCINYVIKRFVQYRNI